MDDDLDSLLTGGPTTIAAATAAAPSAVTTTTQSQTVIPAASQAQLAAPMEQDDDEGEEEDEDDGFAVVLDAPTGNTGGTRPGAFGTPINIKTQRYNKWGTPTTPAAPPTASPAQAAPASAASTAAVVSSTSFAPLIAPSSVTHVATAASGGTVAPSTTSSTAVRPFRLPLPNDNIFESGQHLDQRVDRPWTLPGADISDWFNYGFDEETWKLYCQKQIQQRINAKLKGKLAVYDGDDPSSRLVQRPPPQPGRPLGMPSMPMFPPNAGGLPMMTPQMMNPNMMRPSPPFPTTGYAHNPQMMNRQAYNDDDASVQLGGRQG